MNHRATHQTQTNLIHSTRTHGCDSSVVNIKAKYGWNEDDMLLRGVFTESAFFWLITSHLWLHTDAATLAHAAIIWRIAQAWVRKRRHSEHPTHDTSRHTHIVCLTVGLWCSSQNELNRKGRREGREIWLPLKNKRREWSRQRASWDRKLRYENTYCWPCFNSSFCFLGSSAGFLLWVIIHKAEEWGSFIIRNGRVAGWRLWVSVQPTKDAATCRPFSKWNVESV